MSDSLPILDPLDVATEKSLRSVGARGTDHLHITLTDDGEDFYCIGFSGLTRDAWRKLPPTIQQTKREFVQDHPELVRKMQDGSSVFQDGSYVSRNVVEWFSNLPECKYLGAKNVNLQNHWVVAGTDISGLMFQHAWDKDRISFSDDAKILYQYVLRRFYSQNFRAAAQAEFKLNKTVPEAPADFKDKPGFELAEYQRFAMQLSLGGDLALFAEQGTGKTPIVIARINLEAKRARAGLLVNPANGKKEPFMYRAILVVPRAVRRNWQKEFTKFSTVAGKVTVMKGGQINRVKLLTHALKSEPKFAFSVVLVSYDTCANDIETLQMIPWNLGCADESHMFKGAYTKRWKQGMSQLREACQYHMVLTGTPIANTIMDLWTQLEFLGVGLSGFKKNKAFRDFHGQFEDRGTADGNTIQAMVGMKNISMIQERLTRLTFRITKQEAGLNLPDKVSDTWEVEMTKNQKETYERLTDSMAVEIENGVADGTMTIDHVLTKLLRLSQVTSGHAKTDNIVDLDTGEIITPGTVIRVADPNPKVIAAIEMMEAKEKDSKAIFWACFIEDIKMLEEGFAAAGIKTVSYYGGTSEADRIKAEEDFNNDPECRVFIGNPKAAGAGLNLLGYEPGTTGQSTYCDLVVFFSQNWSATERSQAEDRAHRRGTKMPVTIRDLVVLDTIDEEIREMVEAKRTRAEIVQDVRAMLSRVLKVDLSTLTNHV